MEFIITNLLVAIDRFEYALSDAKTKWYDAMLPGCSMVLLELAYLELIEAHGCLMSFPDDSMPDVITKITEQLALHNVNPMHPDSPERMHVGINMYESISRMIQALVYFEDALLDADTGYRAAQQIEEPVLMLQLVLENLNQAYRQFRSVSEEAMPAIEFMIWERLLFLNDNLVDPNAAEPEPVEPDVVAGSEDHNGGHAGAGSGEAMEQDLSLPEEAVEQKQDIDVTGAVVPDLDPNKTA